MAVIRVTRLMLTMDTETEMLQWMRNYDESEGFKHWLNVMASWDGVSVHLQVGAPIPTGAFKVRLEGYHDGYRPGTGAHFEFLGYWNPMDSWEQVEMLVDAYIQTRVEDRVSKPSQCVSRFHSPTAEVTYRADREAMPSREEMYLLITGRCRTCYTKEAQDVPDFSSLIPEAEPTRSWRR